MRVPCAILYITFFVVKQNRASIDCEDDFYLGCQNVSYQLQSFTGLP